jgi:hypothetical protein
MKKLILALVCVIFGSRIGEAGFISLDVAKNLDGRLEVLAVGTDEGAYHAWQLTSGGNWSAWTRLDNQQRYCKRLAVGRRQDGRLAVIASRTNGGLYYAAQAEPNGSWSELEDQSPDGSLPARFLSGFSRALATGYNQDGCLEFFWLGNNARVYHSYETPSERSAWSMWSFLGSPGQDLSEIAVGTNQDGRLEVFAASSDGKILHIWQTAPNGDWSSWTQLGNSTESFRAVAAATNSNGHQMVFAVNIHGEVYKIEQSETLDNWSDWSPLTVIGQRPPAPKSLTAARRQDGSIALFAIGDDNRIYYVGKRELLPPQEQAPGPIPALYTGDFSSGWMRLGSESFRAGLLTTEEDASGSLQVFAIGTDFDVYEYVPRARTYVWTPFASGSPRTTSIAVYNMNLWVGEERPDAEYARRLKNITDTLHADAIRYDLLPLFDWSLFGLNECHSHRESGRWGWNTHYVADPIPCCESCPEAMTPECLDRDLRNSVGTVDYAQQYGEIGVVAIAPDVSGSAGFTPRELHHDNFGTKWFGTVRRTVFGGRFSVANTDYILPLYSTHISTGQTSDRNRSDQLDGLVDAIKEWWVPGDLTPVLVGDFNSDTYTHDQWDILRECFTEVGPLFYQTMIENVWIGRLDAFPEASGQLIPIRCLMLREFSDGHVNVSDHEVPYTEFLTPDEAVTYRIDVTTGSRDKAGTDADVYITVYGTKGASPESYLDHPEYDDFERGTTDSYTLQSFDLGNLTKIYVRHDNSEDDPGWYLKYIRVTNEKTGSSWVFPCDRWLATDEGDHRTDVTLSAQ